MLEIRRHKVNTVLLTDNTLNCSRYEVFSKSKNSERIIFSSIKAYETGFWNLETHYCVDCIQKPSSSYSQTKPRKMLSRFFFQTITHGSIRETFFFLNCIIIRMSLRILHLFLDSPPLLPPLLGKNEPPFTVKDISFRFNRFFFGSSPSLGLFRKQKYFQNLRVGLCF